MVNADVVRGRSLMLEEEMTQYPHSFENGAGERLTFIRRLAEVDGDRLEGENVVAPGVRPPMHVHYLQDEGKANGG